MQHFARIGVGSVNPTALARAGYWQGRALEAAGRAQEARAAYAAAAEQSTSYYGQLARAKLGLAANRAQCRALRPRRRTARDRPRRATALRSGRRRNRRADSRRHGRERRSRSAGGARRTRLASRRRPRHAAGRQGRAQSRAAVRLLRLSGNGDSALSGDRSRGRAQRHLLDRAAGERVQSTRCLAGAGLWPDAGDAGCRPLCLQARRRRLRPGADEDRRGLQRRSSARPNSAVCSRTIAAPTS